MSWRPSWRSPSPARTAASRDVAEGLYRTCAATDAAYVAPAAFGHGPGARRTPGHDGRRGGARPGAGHQPRLPGEPPAPRRRAARRVAVDLAVLDQAMHQHRVGAGWTRPSGQRYTSGSSTHALDVVTNLGPAAPERPGRPLPGRGGEHPRRARGVLPGAGPRRRRAPRPGWSWSTRPTPYATGRWCDGHGARVRAGRRRHVPHCGEPVDAGASFCEACGKPLDAAGGVDGPSAPADAAPKGPDGRPRQRPDQCLGPAPAHGGAAAAGATCLPELRRRGRAGRLLRVVRGQGAQRARPLPRAARVVGGRRVRQGHPAHPQRGRDGAAGVRRAGWPGGARRPRRGLEHRRLRGRLARRREGRARGAADAAARAGWAPPRAAGPRSPRSSPRAPRAPTTRCRRHRRKGRANPPRRRTSWRCSRAARVSYANIGDSRAYWLPDDAPGGAAERRRLRGPGADRGRCAPGRGGVLADGARDHPLARPRRARPRAAGR